MTHPLTLIQLISEQTVQNLLPILRLKPQKLLHLVTPKTAARSAALESGARAAGIHATFKIVQLSAMPSIPECFNAVAGCLSDCAKANERPVVNFTGGTKLMSIGAYAAALQAKAPSLYVDTQDACFVDGATSPEMQALLGGDWSFTPIRNPLRVDVLAVANGVPRVTDGKRWSDFLPFSEHLFRNRQEEEATHAAFHGPSGLCPNGREPRNAGDWLKIIDRPIRVPERVAELAVAAGFVRGGSNTGEVRLPDGTRGALKELTAGYVADFNNRYFQAVVPIQQAISFLTGGWWEIIVCAAAERSGLFRDLRWSVQVGEQDGPDTEEDVLALDGVELLYINCKRGGPKARLQPLLEEVRARASTIGGAFNRRFLALRYPPTGKVAANLQQRARELGVRLLTGDNLNRPGIFAR